MNVNRRPTPARCAWLTGKDADLVPPADVPTFVKPNRQSGEVAKPPARQPQEGAHDRRSAEHQIE